MTPGYKQTEIGPAPQDWDERTLSKCAEIDAGINKPLAEMGSGALYVTVQDLYDGTSIDSEQLGRIRVSSREIQTRSLMAGDIVFGKSSVKRDGIGYPSRFVGCREPVVFSGFTYRIRARRGLVDPAFLFHWLRSTKTRRWVIDKSQSSALTNLNRSIADAIPVVLPPLSEQEAIAEALSDADALIESIEQLIAKKRQLKQGSMQELLTGRRRLPGFSGEWRVVRFRDLLSYERPDRYIVQDTAYADRGTVPVLTANKSFVLGYTTESFGICHDLPAIVFDDFTTASKYADFPFKVKSSAIKLLRAKHDQVNLQFVFDRMQLIRFSLGDHKRYYISEFQELGLEVPETEEQTAIAAVLADMSAEIAVLEATLAKTRSLKQGMMQVLLTGRIRLV